MRRPGSLQVEFSISLNISEIIDNIEEIPEVYFVSYVEKLEN